MPRRLSSCSVGSEKTAEGVIRGAVRSALSTAVCSIIDRTCKKYYTKLWHVLRGVVARSVQGDWRHVMGLEFK